MKKIFVVVVALIIMASFVVAYDYPSTNELNRDAENPLRSGVGPHVNEVEAGIGYVTLEFVNPYNYWACFEYRLDGDTTLAISQDHFNPYLDDDLYPYYCLNAGVTGTSVNHTFFAQDYVQVRLAFGAERDWDFNWTRFDVLELCPGTVPDQFYQDLGVNRHYWDGESFKTLVPARRGQFEEVESEFSFQDTKGCSCNQILDIMEDATGEDFEGHRKFGCSKSVIEAFVDGKYFIEQVEVPSENINGSSSMTTLSQDFTYRLVASGIWQNGDLHTLDAHCRLLSGETEWELSEPRSLRLQVDEEYVNWGNQCAADHVYEFDYAGLGEPVNFRIVDGMPPVLDWYADNVGSLYVDIYALLW